MDQAKEAQKILLLAKASPDAAPPAWIRLQKACQSFSQPDLQIKTDSLALADLAALAKEWSHVFIDLSLLKLPATENITIGNVTIIQEKSFPWNSPESRNILLPILTRYPCVILEDLSLADLIRTLHLYLNTKRLAGVTAMMEKGSLVVGEKVQSVEAIGSLTDKLVSFLEHLDGFTLQQRVSDLRQVLTGLLGEAFRQTTNGNARPYPTMDFQVGAGPKKIAVNLRFPRGDLKPNELSQLCLEGHSLFWQQIWLCSDALSVTVHSQYDEIEVMALITQPTRPPLSEFRTFLRKTSERSAKSENLLAAPANFSFHVLSSLRVKENETVQLSISEDSKEIDFGSLPEPVLKQIAKLAEENSFLKETKEKRETVFREAQIKLSTYAKELNQKKSDVTRLGKAIEVQQEAFQKKITELEKALEQTRSAAKSAITASVDKNASSQMQETITKLEGSLKSAENEKHQMQERSTNDLKKLAAIEQKYTTLYKDIAAKDKEIMDLKATLLKSRKDAAGAGAAAAATAKSEAANEGASAKLKEAEAREAVLKQELRKVAFKLENNEKNVKVIQAEAAEKSKLLEQKLQGAKTKEVELLKKIEELTNALKKAAKAA